MVPFKDTQESILMFTFSQTLQKERPKIHTHQCDYHKSGTIHNSAYLPIRCEPGIKHNKNLKQQELNHCVKWLMTYNHILNNPFVSSLLFMCMALAAEQGKYTNKSGASVHLTKGCGTPSRPSVVRQCVALIFAVSRTIWTIQTPAFWPSEHVELAVVPVVERDHSHWLLSLPSQCTRGETELTKASKRCEEGIFASSSQHSNMQIYLHIDMAIWNEETEDQLMSMIQERPALYDITEHRYANRVVKTTLAWVRK